jgi:polyhydroxyalkanoate synthesis repressor PhaR
MSSDPQTTPTEPERPRRIIKRYSNRKLYDTRDSRYVTLAQIAELVRAGEDVQVIDNASKEDKTEATLALIISEEIKSTPKAVPLSTLRELVHSRSEKLLSQLREGPIGRFIHIPNGTNEDGTPVEVPAGEAGAGATTAPAPVAVPAPPAPPPTGSQVNPAPSKTRLQELMESSKQTIDQWQGAIDERIRAMLPPFFGDVQAEVKKLNQRVDEFKSLGARVDELEKRVKTLTTERDALLRRPGEVAPKRTSTKE